MVAGISTAVSCTLAETVPAVAALVVVIALLSALMPACGCSTNLLMSFVAQIHSAASQVKSAVPCVFTMTMYIMLSVVL